MSREEIPEGRKFLELPQLFPFVWFIELLEFIEFQEKSLSLRFNAS